jgi:hypothetical protein
MASKGRGGFFLARVNTADESEIASSRVLGCVAPILGWFKQCWAGGNAKKRGFALVAFA